MVIYPQLSILVGRGRLLVFDAEGGRVMTPRNFNTKMRKQLIADAERYVSIEATNTHSQYAEAARIIQGLLDLLTVMSSGT